MPLSDPPMPDVCPPGSFLLRCHTQWGYCPTWRTPDDTLVFDNGSYLEGISQTGVIVGWENQRAYLREWWRPVAQDDVRFYLNNIA